MFKKFVDRGKGVHGVKADFSKWLHGLDTLQIVSYTSNLESCAVWLCNITSLLFISVCVCSVISPWSYWRDGPKMAPA